MKYAEEPLLLNVEMCDFIHDGETVNRPNNAQEIYLKELGSESPKLVRLIMKSIHKQNKREVKHIGCKRFGIQYLLKGIYTHNGLLYFHTEIRNQSNVPFDVDYITWKIVDKKVAKRTAVQEQYHPAAPRAELRHTRAGKEERTHGIHDGEVHHSRRQVPRCGTEREERRSPPVVRGERGYRSGPRSSTNLKCNDHEKARGYNNCVMLALFTGQAHAQRCLPEMQGIEVGRTGGGFKHGFGNAGVDCTGIALSTYTKNGNRWVVGGEYLEKSYKDPKDSPWRSSRRRAVIS